MKKDLLRNYLKNNRIKQTDFARQIGISPEGLRQIMDNGSKHTKVTTAIKIYNLTGIPFNDIFDVPAIINLVKIEPNQLQENL